MKLKNVLNPFGITFEDFKNPAFQEGMIGAALWFGGAALIGWTVGMLLGK